ncbi:MAG: molybdopterin-dependent oxidoreductase [Planctomycetes bacterium]|nr:molybdopterin-dependent oxidoreductase [Planctomycetota bacterium]
MSREFQVLGGRAPRVDARDKVTGRALYAADLKRPGMLFGALVHSPLAHARIVRVNADRALRLPGVKAVLLGKDVPQVRFGVSPARYDETVLAQDKVRYAGDEVAAVAAVDAETALAAAALVEVEYEELEAVLDAPAAMAPGAPKLHDMYPGNICAEVHQEFGDVARARGQAEVIRQDTFTSKMQSGAFLEPQCALAEFDHAGRLTLWSATQTPHYVQRTLAMVLGLPEHRVRVVKPYVGGGFGPKASASSMEIATCLLARATGRPVKTVFSREQVFLHGRARHQFRHEMETGIRRDGTLVFLEHRAVLDGGAFASFGIATVYYSGSLLGGPYRLPNMKYDGWRVVTNKPACGAQRGHGAVHARALFEQQLDLLAEEIGMDPIELRLKNVMQAGDVTCNDLNMSSLGMRECIEAVRADCGWDEKRLERRPAGRGIGMACGFFVSGAGYPIYRSRTPHCTVRVRVDENGGGVHVLSGAAEIGQGSDTMLATITAEALGIPLDLVTVFSGDTDLALDLGAYSSRTTLMTGHAAKEAAESVLRQILEALARAAGEPAEDFSFVRGLLHLRGAPYLNEAIRAEFQKEHRGFGGLPAEGPLTFREVSRFAFLERGLIIGTGQYRPPPLGGGFKGAAVGTSPAYGCSAQVAEVAVDLETGQVKVLRITGAHDCGQAVNRTQVEGQMHGSMSMGHGEALYEQVLFDARGRIQNPNLSDYKIPTALDSPELKALIVESHEPNGPFGAKEVGEGGIMPTIPAILNAIRDATGVVIDELPATPERVLAGIRKLGRPR